MFKPAVKSELCQVSLTGMRALIILGFLIQKPMSLDEIKHELVSLNLVEENCSKDIIRIDLNTLKIMGCEISGACKRTNGKFILTKHPFALNLTIEEVHILKRIYKKIKEQSDFKTLFVYDSLFRKIADHILDEQIREELYGILAFKSYKNDLLVDLTEDCKHHNIITLLYKSPVKDADEEQVIALQKLVFENEKICLYGYSFTLKDAIILNIKRIKSILNRKSGGNVNQKPVVIKFHLKEFGINGLDKNESIVGQDENGYIIHGKYHNDFTAMQRMLSFGSDCTVLEPADFREKIIQNLKNMKEVYKDE